MLSSRQRPCQSAFTIVEVMMAAVILVVGFIGMISAVTVGSEMLATARRQNLAAQIINHELEKLRYVDFATIDAYAAGPTTLTIDTQFSNDITACGLTTDNSNLANPYIKLERSMSGVVTGGLCQVTFTVTWQKSGTTAAANTATGSWLENLSFRGSAPVQRTYVRKGVGFFGKYGLNLNVQRS
jgi:Tfp pilus assembly protein PilV